MTVIALDQDMESPGFYDIYLDPTGNIATVSDINAKYQIVQTGVFTYLGECPLAKDVGVDWNGILGSNLTDQANLYDFQNQIEQEILQLPEVESVDFDTFVEQGRVGTQSLEVIFTDTTTVEIQLPASGGI